MLTAKLEACQLAAFQNLPQPGFGWRHDAALNPSPLYAFGFGQEPLHRYAVPLPITMGRRRQPQFNVLAPGTSRLKAGISASNRSPSGVSIT